MGQVIPILSLVIAVLATIVGPTARRQISSSLQIARIQAAAPVAQLWIRELRDSIAELCGHSRHYWAAGFEDREDADYKRITFLEHKVALMLDLRIRSNHICAILSEGWLGRLK